MKDNSLYLLHNDNSRDSSLHYVPFLLDVRVFPGIPWRFPVSSTLTGVSAFVAMNRLCYVEMCVLLCKNS